jgi:hypothetical protein
MGDTPEKSYRTQQPIETIFRLLEQQRANLERWPYTPEQLDMDKKISARLRELCDQLPGPRSTPLGAGSSLSITQPSCPL